MTRKPTVLGFRLPDAPSDLTADELAWMTFLRDLHNGPVAPPALRALQALRQALWLAR